MILNLLGVSGQRFLQKMLETGAVAEVAPSWCGCCTMLVRMLHHVGAEITPAGCEIFNKITTYFIIYF